MTPELVVAAALLIFLALVWWKGRAAILAVLDKRTDAIRNQLDEARRLREEAEAMYADIAKKQQEATATAAAMIEEAQEQAGRIEREAETALQAAIARRREQALEKIGQAEAEALREVRAKAVDIAIEASRRVLAEDMAGASGQAAVDAAIAELPRRLN
ncbi:MAG: F0F1 ATP synthase subunit B [Alphaproteobacteria bacterium]|nr:F0F1 ATP synthase subunit B [Alphaproteobacteria bacterium]MCB9931157.1 F0F1 ATP synthase subunit B [Alphaproteobacteria bacterium]